MDDGPYVRLVRDGSTLCCQFDLDRRQRRGRGPGPDLDHLTGLAKANGDPSLNLFDDASAPNTREDDAQNGPDHLDAHRTVALIVSPYTQTGAVDSTFYSTSSMLRTIELIVGLPPMTQFDAAATPMLASFTDTPNLRPYSAVLPDQPQDPRADPSWPGDGGRRLRLRPFG